MFKIALQVKQTGKDIMELRLPPWMRFIFLFFVLFILFSMIYFPIEEGARGTDYFPLLFLIMALFVTLYEEKWVFNIKTGTIEKRFGLVFYYSKETADIADVKHIEISEVRKGNKNKSSSKYLKMTLVFKNETEKDMELVYFREKEKFMKNAALIADFCKIPLKK